MTHRRARDAEPTPAGADDAPPWRLSADGVTIGAARCGACGSVQVPFQTLGCRRCGSTDLARVELPAHGRLRASVVVWRHPARPVPYTLGEIELDGGPIVVALMDASAVESNAAGLPPGCLVRCTALTDDESPLPVFVVAGGRAHERQRQ